MRWAALVLLVSFSGCLAPAPALDLAEATGPARPDALQLDYDGYECTTVGIIPWVEPSEVYAFLPPGFWPADAGATIGSPAATGKALVTISWTTCASWANGSMHASGNIAILVEAPNIEGVPKQPGWDFYEVVHMTDDAAFMALLQDWHWPVKAADGSVLHPLATAATPRSSLTIAMEGRTAFEATAAGGQTFSIDGKAIRYWHRSPDGLALRTLTASATGAIGIGTCAIPQDSPLAPYLPPALVEGEACRALVNSMFLQGLDWDTEFRFFPGAVP